MNPGLLALIIVLGVVILVALIIVIWWIRTSNRMRREIVKIDEALSGIDVALTKRYDLLTKSISAVKGYAKHEVEVLEKITQLRCPGANSTIEEKNEFAKTTGEALKTINLLAENYPNLRASENFSNLQAQISEVEEQLQASRRVYNSNVSYFNQEIVVFPGRVVAKRNNFTKKEFFVADEEKKADVKIEF